VTAIASTQEKVRPVPAQPAVASLPARPAPRLAALDGLRLCAALSVLGGHYTIGRVNWNGDPAAFPRIGKVFSYGGFGVQLFFLISGFVICKSSWGRGLGEFVAGVAMYLMHRFRPTPLLWGIVGFSWILAQQRTAQMIDVALASGQHVTRWAASAVITGCFLAVLAVATPYGRSRISAPSGKSDTGTSFTLASPSGMPMIEMNCAMAAVMWPSANHQPATMIQMILPIVDATPASGRRTTSRPKGQSA